MQVRNRRLTTRRHSSPENSCPMHASTKRPEIRLSNRAHDHNSRSGTKGRRQLGLLVYSKGEGARGDGIASDKKRIAARERTRNGESVGKSGDSSGGRACARSKKRLVLHLQRSYTTLLSTPTPQEHAQVARLPFSSGTWLREPSENIGERHWDHHSEVDPSHSCIRKVP